jgi:hypothetical protein
MNSISYQNTLPFNVIFRYFLFIYVQIIENYYHFRLFKNRTPSSHYIGYNVIYLKYFKTSNWAISLSKDRPRNTFLSPSVLCHSQGFIQGTSEESLLFVALLEMISRIFRFNSFEMWYQCPIYKTSSVIFHLIWVEFNIRMIVSLRYHIC